MLERKVGGKFHLKLNIGSRPIANKYHEGKVKRTLKREFWSFEIFGPRPHAMGQQAPGRRSGRSDSQNIAHVCFNVGIQILNFRITSLRVGRRRSRPSERAKPHAMGQHSLGRRSRRSDSQGPDSSWKAHLGCSGMW